MNEAMAPEIQTVFLPASPDGAPDHRHTRAADRQDGRRHFAFRAGDGRRASEEEIREVTANLIGGASMIRILAVVAALVCASPAFAQAPEIAGRRRSAEHAGDRHHQGPHRDQAAHRSRAEACRAPEAARARRLLQQRAVPSRDGRLHGADRRRRRNSTAPATRNIRISQAEFTQTPFKRGVVGMARATDPNSANSQFFIMLRRRLVPQRPIHRDRRGASRAWTLSTS